jgi:hypothetical protein
MWRWAGGDGYYTPEWRNAHKVHGPMGSRAIDELRHGSHIWAMVSVVYFYLALSERVALGTPPFLFASLVVILLFSTCRCGIPIKWSKWTSSSHEWIFNCFHAFEALFGSLLLVAWAYSEDLGESMLLSVTLGVSFFGLFALVCVYRRNQKLRPLVLRATWLIMIAIPVIIFPPVY